LDKLDPEIIVGEDIVGSHAQIVDELAAVYMNPQPRSIVAYLNGGGISFAYIVFKL
jgi:hypothetical protein